MGLTPLISALQEALRLIPEFRANLDHIVNSKKEVGTSLALTVETPPHSPGMTF